ncbi:hypothetical protein JCM8547_004500 [Rhodosporidiobolus lusitaniae]
MNLDKKIVTLAERVPSFVFTEPEGKEGVVKEYLQCAFTHSSKSAVNNWSELAKVGDVSSTPTFTYGMSTKPLAVIAKEIKLEEFMRLDKGVPYVSETMYAECLTGLFGALRLTSGAEALLATLKALKIMQLPEAPVLAEDSG